MADVRRLRRRSAASLLMAGAIILPAASPALAVVTLAEVNAPSAFSAPSDLRATSISPTGFTLSWQPSKTGVVAAYDVFRNGVLVGTTNTLSFTAANLAALNAYTLTVAARDAAGDSVISATPLSVPDAADTTVSTANDGIPDRWKLAHGFSVTSPEVAAADPDGDGKTNQQEFTAGTDPNDYYEGMAVTVTRLTPAGQLGPDDTLSYRLTGAGGKLLVNAPLTFTASSGGHKLLLDGADTPSTTVNARSDSQGVVNIYLVAEKN